MPKLFLLVTLFLVFRAPLFAYGDLQSPWQFSNEFRLTWENDAFGGTTDANYTNGMRFEISRNFHKAEATDDNPETYLPTFLWALMRDANETDIFEAFSFGQNMYTPNDITKTEIQIGDRPYSAWGYAGIFWGVNYQSGNWSSQHRIDFEIGAIGDKAAGRPFQSIIHEYITYSPEPQGWGLQTHRELGLRLGYSYKSLYKPIGIFQGGYQFALNLGNVMTNVSPGLIFKFGRVKDNSAYGKSRGLWPEPILANYSGVGPFKAKDRYSPGSDSAQFYFFINPSVTAVAFNGHLEGGVFNRRTTAVSNYDYYDYAAYDSLAVDAAPLYKTLSYEYFFENSIGITTDKYEKYIYLYRPIFNQTGAAATGMDFLIFNTLFNGGETLTDGDKFLILDDLFQNPVSSPVERYFIIASLLNDGHPLNPALRFLAYYTLVLRQRGVWDPIKDTLVFYQLFQKIRLKETYVVKKRPYFGAIRLGFVLEFGDYSLSYTGVMRTLEFFKKRELSSRHYYGELQFSVRW